MTSPDEKYLAYFGQINELTFEVETTQELSVDSGFSITATVVENRAFGKYVTIDEDPVEYYNRAAG